MQARSLKYLPARDHLPEKQELYRLAIRADTCRGLSIRKS